VIQKQHRLLDTLGSLPANATFFLRVKFFRSVAAFIPGLRKSFSNTTPLDLSWRYRPGVHVCLLTANFMALGS
jgi:hypothetical protein